VSAQAEVAGNQEQLIIAETAVKQTEDRLRVLILDPTVRDSWTVQIDTIDSPPVGTATVDVDAAVTRALDARADLQRARKDIINSETAVKYADNQRLPDIRLNASYQASGLGGTQVLRTGGFPGTIVGPGPVTDFGSVLGQLFAHDFPTWAAGVSVTYPIGGGAEQANYARTKLERSQAGERLKSAQAKAIQEIRDAAWKIEMNAKRIETTRAARELAEQRLDAERKRFEVGMSTSFLVIQAQRDMAQAKTNELSAVLSYDLSLVDYEALQQAGPAVQSTGTSTASSAAAAQGAAPAAPAPAAATGRSTTVSGLPGVPQGQ
jgi:outer membrane protein TolC